ncbi:hypothetical protein V7793_11515 [Streptomyces sp. KLMMK]
MVEVRGMPILRHQIDWFAESAVEHVIVSAGYRAAAIIDYLGSQELPLRADVVVEERPLGRGGAGGAQASRQGVAVPRRALACRLRRHLDPLLAPGHARTPRAACHAGGSGLGLPGGRLAPESNAMGEAG